MKSGKGSIILFLIVLGFVVYMLLGVARKPERSHAPAAGKPRKAAMNQIPNQEPDPASGTRSFILEGELHPGQTVTIPVRSTTHDHGRALVRQSH